MRCGEAFLGSTAVMPPPPDNRPICYNDGTVRMVPWLQIFALGYVALSRRVDYEVV